MFRALCAPGERVFIAGVGAKVGKHCKHLRLERS